MLDTSLFFKYGEISNVNTCSEAITKIMAKMNFGLYYLKPNIIVLYNDVCSADAKFLYKSVLESIGYNKLSFVPLTKLVKRIGKGKNLVVCDGDYYTLVNRGEKCMSLESIDFDPIILGKNDDSHVHYSDGDIVWKSFKTYFTNKQSYDMIGVGDDEC